ncbi:MAG: hypothetical protein U0797_30615 [Gemmataceae bacterium]
MRRRPSSRGTSIIFVFGSSCQRRPIDHDLSAVVPAGLVAQLGRRDQLVVVGVVAAEQVLRLGDLLAGQLAVPVPVEDSDDDVGQVVLPAGVDAGRRHLDRPRAVGAVVGAELLERRLAVAVGVELLERHRRVEAAAADAGDVALQELQHLLGVGRLRPLQALQRARPVAVQEREHLLHEGVPPLEHRLAVHLQVKAQ